MIKTDVYVGIGMWKVHATVDLVACPHVGDTIDVLGTTVTCERVNISSDKVIVEETIRFQRQSDLDEFVQSGWERT